MELVFAKLILTLRLQTEVHDPYLLFSVKSGFAQSFQQAVCRADGLCPGCRFRPDCAYHAVFSRELASDSDAVKRFQKPSVPFVFQIPVLETPLRKGCEVELGLVLIGSATRFLGEFCTVLRDHFPRGASRAPFPCAISRIESVGCSGYRTLLATDSGSVASDLLTTISLEDLAALDTLAARRLHLRMVSPLRIAHDGGFYHEFSFSPFIRTLLRRISSLAYYYYGSILEMDYKRLAVLAESITVTESSFHWHEWRSGRLAGITGEGVLCGDLSDFHPALLLGEYLHCGKDAAFGFGRFAIGERASN